VNPRGVYERLYRAGTVQNSDAAKLDTLLLDRVLGDAKRLRAEVGAADGARLDEYLSVMRSIEQRVQRASKGEKRDWKPRVQLKPDAAPPEVVSFLKERMAARSAGRSDAMKLCPGKRGNEAAACLRSNADKITAECKSALAKVPAPSAS